MEIATEMQADNDLLTEEVDLIAREFMTHKQSYIDYNGCKAEEINTWHEIYLT